MLLPSLRRLRSRAAAARTRCRPRRVWFAAADRVRHRRRGRGRSAPDLLSVAAGACSAWLAMVLGLRRLLPPGTARFAPGVPAAIAFRGVLAGDLRRHGGAGAADPDGAAALLADDGRPAADAHRDELGRSPRRSQGRLRSPNRPGCSAIGLVLFGARRARAWRWSRCARCRAGSPSLVWPIGGFGAGLRADQRERGAAGIHQRRRPGLGLLLAAAGRLVAVARCRAAFSGALVALAATGRISYRTGCPTAYLSWPCWRCWRWAGRPGCGRPTDGSSPLAEHPSRPIRAPRSPVEASRRAHVSS